MIKDSMPINSESKETKIIRENISYYNQIAAQYNHQLDQDKENALTRDYIANIFSKTILEGTVLDFGGGTGRDLAWLSGKKYRIIFCEPSSAMREIAIRYNNEDLHYNDIVFLEEANTDFRIWMKSLPFEEKADAVLCNFAVMNCIPALPLLFESLAAVTRKGSHLFTLLLNRPFTKRWQANRRATLQSIFSGATVETIVEAGNLQQTVFLHSPAAIKKASGNYFDLLENISLSGQEFSLIHMVRK